MKQKTGLLITVPVIKNPVYTYLYAYRFILLSSPQDGPPPSHPIALCSNSQKDSFSPLAPCLKIPAVSPEASVPLLP